jgi:hypothetical protein
VVVRTLAFLVVRLVLAVIGAGRTPDAKDVEIAVLRLVSQLSPGRMRVSAGQCVGAGTFGDRHGR